VLEGVAVTLYVLACGLHALGLAEPSVPEALPGPYAIAAESYDKDSLDLTSLTEGVDPIDAQVQLAMTSVRATGVANAAVGQRFTDVRKLSDDFEVAIESEVRTALSRLVENRDIDILRIAVVKGEDWSEVTVDYFNRRMANPQKRTYVRKY
jgi:hypothetical protein